MEVIVHEDGSTSGELRDWLRQMIDGRVISTLIENPPNHNQGVGEAIRRSFSLAASDTRFKIDQDLLFHPRWLERAMAALDAGKPPRGSEFLPLYTGAGEPDGAVMIDAEDYARASQFRWRKQEGEAVTGNHGEVSLVDFLVEPATSQFVWHLNKRRLDCRRGNMVLLGADDDRPALVKDTPPIGFLGLMRYEHDPVDHRKTLIEDYGAWSHHTHILGSAFAVTAEAWKFYGGLSTHSTAFAEDWEYMKRLTDDGLFACALPPEDLCLNRGFGVGPSTVVKGWDDEKNEGILQGIEGGPLVRREGDRADG